MIQNSSKQLKTKEFDQQIRETHTIQLFDQYKMVHLVEGFSKVGIYQVTLSSIIDYLTYKLWKRTLFSIRKEIRSVWMYKSTERLGQNLCTIFKDKRIPSNPIVRVSFEGFKRSRTSTVETWEVVLEFRDSWLESKGAEQMNVELK